MWSPSGNWLIDTVVVGVVGYAASRFLYGVLLSPLEVRFRNWLLKTPSVIGKRLRLRLVRDVVRGVAHSEGSPQLATFVFVMFLGPMLLITGGMLATSTWLADSYQREIDKGDNSEETAEQKVERYRGDARHYLHVIEVGFAILLIFTMVREGWHYGKMKLTVDHDRFISLLQRLLTDDELKQLIRARDSLDKIPSSTYDYVCLVNALKACPKSAVL